MIQLFDIKKKVKQMKISDKELFSKYSEISQESKEKILENYKTKEKGLIQAEYEKRLKENGPNVVVKNEKKSWFVFLLKSFNDKFIYILFLLAIIDFVLADKLGAGIIVGIAIVSALIKFVQDYSSYRFNQKLKAQIYSSTNVVRNGKEKEIKVENVVIGDIIKLNAGSIIPADVILIESKDLFLNQSVFTGESVLVEKTVETNEAKGIFDINNICLMGSSVVSGSGTAVVIQTGFNTYLGRMSKEIDTKKEPTNFEKGMDSITKLLIKYMVIVSIAVFIIYAFIRHNLTEALLFALSVAVGITPSMLPMIVNVNLTKGSKTLAKKKTLVKNSQSIQNLGAIDILCTDKTGTLTQDKIILQKYINVLGEEDSEILKYAYLNSYYGTGIKNLVDKAVIAYGNKHKIKDTLKEYEKVDEIPFDYVRKRMSVVVKNKDGYRMITKGAIEEILKCCKDVKYKDEIMPLTEELKKQIEVNANNLSNVGMQVIALASKTEYSGLNVFNSQDEKNMTFVGYVAFLDPPKKEVKNTLSNLRKIGISTKILTGDNAYATKNICSIVGLKSDNIITGVELDQLSEEELSKKIEEVDVFARLNPLQKERVVNAYKKNGHVVGYMGDGVNDAPSLHTADVGICVDSATDIAKEASDILLLEKSLKVVYDGVMEGRKVYGNIIKYMKMALSSDFGDVFSILIASIFLPFLPLLPIQMLIQDFLYDISQVAIPYDDVDKEFLEKPKKWETKGLGKFMNVMGITSSITDVLAFIVFWFVFGYNSIEKQAWFQTAWFVECLISETMIIHYIRTSKMPFVESKANKALTISTLITIIGTIITPIIFHNVESFNFVILPIKYYLFVVILLIIYTILVQKVKKIYIKKNGEWL
ncbi:MAG: magnesium-translocating P-type ATPase [Clostridia bacterium]